MKKSIFRSDHASNYLSLKGALNLTPLNPTHYNLNYILQSKRRLTLWC